MQSAGGSAHGGLGERISERLDELVALSAITGAHAAQVAVEFAPVKEVGKRVLLDPRRAPVGEQLLVHDRLKQRGRDDEPSEPEGRSQCLADRPGVYDAVGVEA